LQFAQTSDAAYRCRIVVDDQYAHRAPRCASVPRRTTCTRSACQDVTMSTSFRARVDPRLIWTVAAPPGMVSALSRWQQRQSKLCDRVERHRDEWLRKTG
jgi:hypothetical protein